MKLHGRGCGEQQTPRAWRDAPQEPQQIIWLAPTGVPRLEASPGTMRFIQNNALEAHVRKPLHNFGAARDQPCGDDADAARAAPDGLVARTGMFDPAFVDPLGPVPHCRWQAEQRIELVLPLL